ncbi:hypothetical protein COW36_08620 [bacterium (Candidatus Blackallbacteria) CG17_big_fil_post_rev_8_21_14_2_50_48_46]|uniref:Uncharacterized protein n=1 Tax=bacterium (Candidatus Blackallbacteria) CG17_big_fil_post_rev_8_21_14_2_50_48_46 TaxID=2014261 RepID=A0A2M7G696_9BACT|nr:MAG: hypothetical protein COW36_08620 [bacterium (Candidatus Blackallbacteria) CG17_big_fil_post_rev_8_21_14_2_50_48_46]
MQENTTENKLTPTPYQTNFASPLPDRSSQQSPLPQILKSPTPQFTPKPLPSPTPSAIPYTAPRPSSSPSGIPARPTSGTLNLVMELHVENAMLPNDQETDYLIQIARTAHNAGLSLSIGLGNDFLRTYQGEATVHTPLNGDFNLNSLVNLLQNSYGHRVSLHADVHENASYSEIVAYLSPLVSELNAAGAEGNIASGACNETGTAGGWVQGALDAGINTIGGVVEDCQASLSQSDYPDLWLPADRATPARNHDAAPQANPQQRARGWFTQDVNHWITPFYPSSQSELDQSLFIVGSMGKAHPACLAETHAGQSCGTNQTETEGQADAQALIADLGEALDNYLSGENGDAYHTAFSTNFTVSQVWLDGYFTTLVEGLRSSTSAAGQPLGIGIRFNTLSGIAEIHRQALSTSFTE